MRERAAALAAAPAVDERRPVARLVGEWALEHRGDVARDQRGAGAPRGERRLLRVHRADARALVVVEHREVRRAGNVVFGELRRAAHVDALGVVGDAPDAAIATLARARRRGPCDSSLRAQQRAQRRPDVVEQHRLRGCGRVDAIGLEQLVALAEAFEEERNQRRLVRVRDRRRTARSNSRTYAGP